MPNYRFITPCGASDVTITFPSTSGTLQLAGGGGITGFTSQISTAAPNATTNVSQLLVAVSTTNGDMALQPKGNGAILAQIPDGTATSGNKRGTYAVDFQRERSANTDVASGSYSAIVNGFRNRSTATYAFVGNGSINGATATSAFVGNGNGNTASGVYSTVVNGNGCTSSSSYSYVGGGNNLQATNSFSACVAGQNNAAAAYASFVGGGESNTVFSNANYAVITGGYANTIDGSASYSTITGGQGGRVREAGSRVFSNFYFAGQGDCQLVESVYSGRTTNATPTFIQPGGGTSFGVTVPLNATVTFRFLVAARQSGTSNIGAWDISGCVENTGGVLTFYNVTINLIHRSVGTWSVAIANNGGAVGVQVTGTANTIQWTATGTFALNLIN